MLASTDSKMRGKFSAHFLRRKDNENSLSYIKVGNETCDVIKKGEPLD